MASSLFKTILPILFSLFALVLAAKVPTVEYDVIVVGGGPAGLSATSALCRVMRKVVMFDTEEYRNAPTRHMHDVIGNDGTVPATFRTAARAQIDKYKTAVFKKSKVVEITSVKSDDGFNWFVARDDAGLPYTARRVILATGVKDILPTTPGILENFGKGMYWCPWCDGYEHREQSLGVLGPLSDALSAALEMHNMNPDTIVMTNGSDTEAQREIATQRSATWQAQFAAYNISIVNTTIARIARLRDGNGRPVALSKDLEKDEYDYIQQKALELRSEPDFGVEDDNSGPNGKHKDLFKVTFADGLSVERSAFIMNIETKQTSHLPELLKLNMTGSKIKVDPKMQTNHTGIFAVGDANDDGSTNVPHAMYTGKKAAVVAHVQLAKEESMASIMKRSLSMLPERAREKLAMRQVGSELEQLWDRMK